MNKTLLGSMVSVCALTSGVLLAAQSPLAQAATSTPQIAPTPTFKTQIAKRQVSKAALKAVRCVNPRGRRLTIYGHFLVTNSDDGFRDDLAEIYGYVNMKGKRLWTVQGTSPQRVSKGDSVGLSKSFTFDLLFNDPSTWNVIVTGFMLERDKGGDDAMWNPLRLPLVVNVKAMYDKRRPVVLAGDRDSESADLILEFGPLRGGYIY